MATKKTVNKFRLEYRQSGKWFALQEFSSRELAVQYAEKSTACRYGYQIKPCKA